jgi:hypothetical protein
MIASPVAESSRSSFTMHSPHQEEGLMGKIAITLAAAALLLGSVAWTAEAQTQGAANIHAQAQNATPIVKAACMGFGRWCPPGMRRVCGPARCWCAPC